MADNITAKANVGAGQEVIATDEIDGIHYPRTKVGFGVGGVYADVTGANPLPVVIDPTSLTALETIELGAASLSALEGVTVGGTVELGATSLAALESVTATGPLTDTQLRASPLAIDGSASTQPVSAVALPLPAGAATEATLTAINSALKAEDSPAGDGDRGIPLLAMRSSNDAVTTSNDGDYTLLKIDEEGRLKVATKPASYPDITGDITAIQATIGTPVAGGTVSGDVSRASNIMAFCSGTFAGVNCSFEGSLELTGETNWFGIQAIRSNANTIESATGALSAQPVYAWEMSVNALKRVRVRATARTSGTQSWRFVQGTYATEPIPGAQATATQPVSGAVTVSGTATTTPAVPTTPYFLNSLASTNGALIITGTSGVGSIYATNTGATAAFIKLYNKATAPTVGTDIPEMIIPVPAAASGIPGVANVPAGSIMYRFALGLGIAITGAVADTDTTAVAAGQVKVKLSRTA